MRRAIVVGLLVAANASRADPPGWDVRVPERLEVALGAGAVLPIAIAVDRGSVVSKDAPVIVEFRAEPGVAFKKRRLGRGDAVDPEADAPRFAVAVRGDTAGSHAVTVRVRLWLCGGRVCRPLDVKRQLSVVVTPAP